MVFNGRIVTNSSNQPAQFTGSEEVELGAAASQSMSTGHLFLNALTSASTADSN